MKHFGDITKLSGYDLPPVDIITGGAPCQDLSVAGLRKGLAGERSGLFMEQIRLVKEMREHDRAIGRTDEFIRPRFMVWENVPGAFSSNGGEDFRCVLEETARVAEKTAVIPRPANGKWAHAGCIMGDGWSIAWRVHDAQFWGVPQRRKRIALVADFGGCTAPEILFERKGMSGDTKPGGTPEKGTSGNVERSVRASEPIAFEPGAASRVGNHVYMDDISDAMRANVWDNQQAVVAFTTEMTPKVDESDVAFSLRSRDYKDAQSVVCLGMNRERCGVVYANDLMPTLQAAAGESGNNKPMVFDVRRRHNYEPFNNVCKTLNCMDDPMKIVCKSAGFDGNMGAKAGNIGYEEEKSPTLNAGKRMHCVFMDAYQHHGWREGNTCGTLAARQNEAINGSTPLVVNLYNKKNNAGEYAEGFGTIRASGGDCGGGSETIVISKIVRRLTPLECERL